MKKITLTIVVLLLSFSAFAQFNFGVKAGGNFSFLATGGEADLGSRMGFNAGGFVEYNIHNNFALQAELLYSLQGTGKEEGGTIGLSFALHYLNLPILAKIKIHNFSILVGPQFGFGVSAVMKVSATEDGIKTTASASLGSEEFSAFDFSVTLGVGYNFYRNLT